MRLTIVKMSRSYLAVIIALLILHLNISHAQIIKEKRAGVKEIGLEFFGATVGEACGCLVGISAAYGALVLVDRVVGPEAFDLGEGLMSLYLGGYLTGGIVGAPLGTTLTGKIIHSKGSVLGACLGGIVGFTVASTIFYKLGYAPQESRFYKIFGEPRVFFSTVFLLPPILSVTGYNLFPSKKSSSASMLLKYTPQCAITCKPLEYNKRIIPEIGMKLTLKF